MGLHFYIFFYVFNFDLQITLQDTFISNIILCIGVWSIILSIKAYPITAVIYIYSLAIAILFSAGVVLLTFETTKWLTNNKNEAYLLWFNKTIVIRFIFVLLFNCWMATNAAMGKIIRLSENRYKNQTDASILIKEAELFKLRQQLQPHFLYNSMNSLSALILIAPEKAIEMVGKLSDFLRSSVKRESEDFMPIADELNYIQSYLDIESIRFGNRLMVNFEKEYTDDAKIPPYLLQPVIENAIKFGLYGNTGKVTISVNIHLDGSLLILTIINPYDINSQPPQGTGFGLSGIKRRLYLLYARADLLETKKDEHFFTTIIKIPQYELQSNIDR